MNFKKLVCVAVVAVLPLLAFGCGSTATKSEQPLKVGVTAGPHAEIMEVVQKVAAKQGLKVKVVEFNDYIQPNVALNQGDIDANSFQHVPYLENMIKDRKYELVSVAKTVIFPMGIYSKKIKDLKALPNNSIFAMPNDPTNGSRALLLLQREGLIKLKPGIGIKASVADIIENPKKIKFKELDAALIPRSLEDADAAAVNTNYAMTAGLQPKKDSLVIEDANSPYVCVIAVQTKNKDNPQIKKLIAAYHSAEVKKFIDDKYKGAIVAGW